MKKSEWLGLIKKATDALEALEELRQQYEDECNDRSETWQESEAAEKASEIHGVDIEAMLDDLENLRSELEA